MSITIEGAARYFATRTVGNSWAEYSAKQRAAAIEQAKRDLSRALGRAMKEDEAPYNHGETKRDEYAVYEQAYHSLVRDADPQTPQGAIPTLESDEALSSRITTRDGKNKWSMEALAWLADKVTVATVLS